MNSVHTLAGTTFLWNAAANLTGTTGARHFSISDDEETAFLQAKGSAITKRSRGSRPLKSVRIRLRGLSSGIKGNTGRRPSLTGMLTSCFGCCTGSDAVAEHNEEQEFAHTKGRTPSGTARIAPIPAPPAYTGDHKASPLPNPARLAVSLGASAVVSDYLASADANTEIFALRAGSPWLVVRDPDVSMRLRWVHRDSGERSWSQPPPKLIPLQGMGYMTPQLAAMAHAALEPFCGAPPSTRNPAARTGIVGSAPLDERIRRTCLLLGPEHVLYPQALFVAINFGRVIFCEELRCAPPCLVFSFSN